MKGLGVPVMNQFGLRPALVKGTKQIAPLTVARDLDTRGWLNGVPTFNFHMHLPHYAVTTTTAARFRSWRASRSIWSARIHSPRRGTGVQLVHLDAARGQAPRAHPARRLDDLHHAVRRHREPGELLEEPRDDVTMAGAGSHMTRVRIR